MTRQLADIRVVKVGGSLFVDPHLAQKLKCWLCEPSARVTILLTGGGAAADMVRTLDQRFQLGEETSHSLAIDAMRILAQALHRMLVDVDMSATWIGDLRMLPEVARLGEIEERPTANPHQKIPAEACRTRVFFLDPVEFMRVDSTGETPCPASWEITSDSIAVRLANFLTARQLVLLKSVAAGHDKSIAELAADGFVDRAFPREAAPFLDAGGEVRFCVLPG